MLLQTRRPINDVLIPTEFAVAPNPLGLAPNLKLTTIPIDAYSCFELWMPLAGGRLLLEEGLLLMGDFPRLEDIAGRLTWLLGGKLDHLDGLTAPVTVDSWKQVQQTLQQSGMMANALGIEYLPPLVFPQEMADGEPIAWTFQPSGWRVVFFNLRPIDQGYQVEQLSYQVQIHCGEAITQRIPAVGSNWS